MSMSLKTEGLTGAPALSKRGFRRNTRIECKCSAKRPGGVLDVERTCRMQHSQSVDE